MVHGKIPTASVPSWWLSRAACPFAKRRDQTFLADLGDRNFDLGAFNSGEEFLFKSAKAALFVLTDQLADIFARRTPITGGNLAFNVLLQGVGQGDV